jgi:hypothetical protein
MARRSVAQLDHDARNEFAELLPIAKQSLFNEELGKLLQNGLNGAVYREWMARNPGKAAPSDFNKMCNSLGDITKLAKPYRDQADADYAQRKATRKAAEDRLFAIAPDIIIHPTDQIWHTINKVHRSSYPNQTANEHYSEVQAELEADNYRKHCPTLVTLIEPYFTIQVGLEYVFEVDVVRYLPGLTLREWLANCMKRGANPRVYNAFLPYGLEAKLGLDNFGNDLKPVQP